jgi:hypothetical protein
VNAATSHSGFASFKYLASFEAYCGSGATRTTRLDMRILSFFERGRQRKKAPQPPTP